MPSPFPGMDPYLEHPRLWLDFHNELASAIRAALNGSLAPHYRARLTSYVAYETVEVARSRRVEADVMVWQVQRQRDEGPVAVAAPSPPPVECNIPMEVPVRLYRVEVVATASEELVALIEILSWSNKRRGHRDGRAYARKRQELLWSSAHLLEIDLLRRGRRPPLEEPPPRAPYYVVLSRAQQRPKAGVWPIQLAEVLPIVPVPLLEPDTDVLLDLGATVASAYERGAFAREIDYRQPPPPPRLGAGEAAWVEALLRESGLRTEREEEPG